MITIDASVTLEFDEDEIENLDFQCIEPDKKPLINGREYIALSPEGRSSYIVASFSEACRNCSDAIIQELDVTVNQE